MPELPELMPGDCLLYSPSSLIGRLICIKTWSDVSHVEIYAGQGKSFASRDGIGVNLYPLRISELKYVLRPNHRFDVDKARLWFYSHACGEKYGWRQLFVFYLIVKRGNKHQKICSQLGALLYRAGGFDAFHPLYDTGKVVPEDFKLTPSFTHVWKRS